MSAIELNVPAPVIRFKALGAAAELEQPVELALPELRLPDGSTVTGDDVRKLGALVYRTTGAGEEIWNEAELQWQAAPAGLEALAALTPVPFTAKPGAAEPWQGLLIAIGARDAAGAARYEPASAGTPTYRVRGLARAQRAGQDYRGLSAPSESFTFASSSGLQRFGVEFDTETARDCRRARMQLKTAGGAPAGYLEFRADGGNEIEIANCDAAGAARARIVLTADGDIRLEPAPGGSIVLGAPPDRVRFSPESITAATLP